jgi:hypothetical protein
MAKWSREDKPWERQKGESSQAFEAFDLYLKMGAERSLRKVAQELHKSCTLISRWNTAWSWQSRCREYDNALKREEFAKAKKEQKKMQDRQILIASLMQQKAVEALKSLDPGSLKPGEILRFITEGAKLETASMMAKTQQTASDAGSDGQSATLADTIISSYQKRMEEE